MRVLITGRDGQLGRALAPLFPDAVLTGRTELDFAANPEIIAKQVEELEPDVVINTAAYTNVDGAEADLDTALQVNATAVQGLAWACDRLGADLIQISTDYVFWGQPPIGHAWHEVDASAHPPSAYGWSKVVGEEITRRAKSSTIIRTSWIFGEGANFVRTMLHLATARQMEVIPVVDDQMGRPTYAADLARAISQLVTMRQHLSHLPPVLHLQNSGSPITWADFAEAIFDQAGLQVKVERISSQEYAASRSEPVAPRPTNSVLDMTGAHHLGLAMPNWSDALARYLSSGAAT